MRRASWKSLKTMNYHDFMAVVASGREVVRADKQSKMPALGDNRNVMCYIEDIYVYLKARADGALPRGRPAKTDRKAGSRGRAREGLLRVTSRRHRSAACRAARAWASSLTVGAAEGQRIDLVNRTALRVCADPANMPFSNDKGEGFENKIAEIVAAELKVPVEYTWFPQATGFIRQTLFAKRCDVVIGYAQGDELVLNTNHYYRSTYALVYRERHRARRRRQPRGPAPEGQAHRRRRRHPARQHHGPARSHPACQALSARWSTGVMIRRASA